MIFSSIYNLHNIASFHSFCKFTQLRLKFFMLNWKNHLRCAILSGEKQSKKQKDHTYGCRTYNQCPE